MSLNSAPRVLHFSPFGDLAGANRSCLTLVTEQAKRRPTFVATLVEGPFSSEARAAGAAVRTAFPAGGENGPRWQRWLRAVRMLRAAIRDWQIDIVHCHSARGNRFAWPAVVRFGPKLVTHQRDTYQHDYFHLWLAHSDHIIAISNWVKESLPLKMRRKTTVVYNAVRLAAGPNRALRPDATLTIGMAGRCRREKGFDLLLNALPPLQGISSFDVQLWGINESGPDADYAGELRSIADSFPPELQRRIRMEPFRADIQAFYELADIVVVPSRYDEPFGRMAIEAMAWQRPVIVSRRGGLCEIVEHRRTGLVFDPDKPGDLEDQLRSLLLDATLRSRLAAAGHEEVKRRFRPGPHADAIDQIYQKLITSV